MRFFNIDKGLELPQMFNIMHDALDELYARRQEEFQKSNPLKEIYKVVPLNQFQKSWASTTGFKQAYERTVDYAAYPGFTNGDGFRATVGYQPFNGKVAFTWQMILEGDAAGISESLSQYQLAWQRQQVEYGMFALTGFFGGRVFDPVSKNYLYLTAQDTVDGDTMNPNKNPVFWNAHNVVRREGMADNLMAALQQSNKFYLPVLFDGSDLLAAAKLADAIYQIKVYQNKLRDDNGQRAGINGRKKLVLTEEARVNQILDSILISDNFTSTTGKQVINMVKDGFDKYKTSYLDGNMDQPIPQFATNASGYAQGILMLDPAFNGANKGPMMVQRLGFSMKAVKTEEPEGIKYLGKEAFDFFCPVWQGVTYLYLGTPAGATGAWDDVTTFTKITPVVFPKVVANFPQTGSIN